MTNAKPRGKKILLLDNYDSFTYNLYDYLLQLGASCQVIRNDALSLEELQQLDFEGIVLSPGPKTPRDAGILMELIGHFFDKKPILGICLGHQAIGEFFDAHLTRADVPTHGKTSLIRTTAHPLFHGLPTTFEVMRYHSLLLKKMEHTDLQAIAWTDRDEIMALAHKKLPLWGVQFHPESILTQHGLKLLNNWLDSF